MRTDCFIFVQRNEVTLSLPIISVKAKLERTPGRKRRRIKPVKLKFNTLCCTFYLLWLIQKELNDVVSALGVVEEDKQGPMNEPCPLLEGLKRGGDGLDGTKFGRQTWEKKRAPERENKIKVKFNIWFVIFIVKLRRYHGKHKERQFKQCASYVVINHTESAILHSNPSS